MSGLINSAGSKSGVISSLGIKNQVHFSVRQNSNLSDETGNGHTYEIPFDTVISDPMGAYNTGTGKFIAPISGVYFLGTMFNMDCAGGSHSYIDAFIKTTDRDFQGYESKDNGSCHYGCRRFCPCRL